ncbi:MAG: lysophospholipid acyltransferase family protein [Armatimonadota bacterium]
MNTNFLPCIKSPMLEVLMDAMMPIAKRIAGIKNISIYCAPNLDVSDILASPALIVSNHPTDMDPILLRTLGSSVRIRFKYLACREGFDGLYGAWGWVAQRIGAFSIVRGTVDRDSFRYTTNLWVDHSARIVVFPEGEVGAFNDKILPFHDGIFQLLLLASEKRVNAGTNPIGIVPVAIRYTLVNDHRQELLDASRKLCAATGAAASHDLIENLKNLTSIVITRLEQEYGLHSKSETTTQERIAALQAAVLARIHAATGKPIPDHGDLHDLMRFSANIIEDAIDNHLEPETLFDKRLAEQRRKRALGLQADIDRLQNWLAIEDGYATADGNQDHAYELIRHFETEVFGDVKTRIARQATVRVGARIEMSDIDGFAALAIRQQIRTLRQLAANAVSDCLAQSHPG